MILNCVYIWKLCFGHFSQSQHSKLAPAADIEKKRHCQFPSRCRMLSTIWFSRWLFLNKILEAVNPNFNCLILYVWWCVLHCKFDAHWTQIWKDTQCFWKIKILGRHTDHPRRVVGSPIPILGDPSLQMWRFRQNLNWVILQIVSPGTTPPPPPQKKRDNLPVFINSTT